MDAAQCVPADALAAEIKKAKPDADILVLDEIHTLIFLSGMKELAKIAPETPPDLITGLMLVYAPGDQRVNIGVLVSKRVCELIQIPPALMLAIIKKASSA